MPSGSRPSKTDTRWSRVRERSVTESHGGSSPRRQPSGRGIFWGPPRSLSVPMGLPPSRIGQKRFETGVAETLSHTERHDGAVLPTLPMNP